MRYNLTPFYDLLDESVPSRDVWRDRFKVFFDNTNTNKALLDLYYNLLINNYNNLYPLLVSGYLIDPYSGLFTFDEPSMKGLHTFNMANFIRRNHVFFNKKSLKTISMDFGLTNIQIKQCGLKLTNVSLSAQSIPGSALLVIGNYSPPYDFKNDEDPDVIFACHVFNTEDEAWENWNMLFDLSIQGKDVFFTSATFKELKKFINYDRIQQMENPSEIYDADLYSNLDMGFMNRIYRII